MCLKSPHKHMTHAWVTDAGSLTKTLPLFSSIAFQAHTNTCVYVCARNGVVWKFLIRFTEIKYNFQCIHISNQFSITALIKKKQQHWKWSEISNKNSILQTGVLLTHSYFTKTQNRGPFTSMVIFNTYTNRTWSSELFMFWNTGFCSPVYH